MRLENFTIFQQSANAYTLSCSVEYPISHVWGTEHLPPEVNAELLVVLQYAHEAVGGGILTGELSEQLLEIKGSCNAYTDHARVLRSYFRNDGYMFEWVHEDVPKHVDVTVELSFEHEDHAEKFARRLSGTTFLEP